MITVSILGYGNVGKHLFHAFQTAKNLVIKQVYSPSLSPKNEGSTQFINELDVLEQADVFLLAIPDDAVAAFSKKLPFEDALVVHTSGSVGMEALDSKNRRGVFYPLQTFSKGRSINFKEIPICVEAEEPKDLVLLKQLAEMISGTVVELSSVKREKLHLAAVWANNFSNHLFHLAKDFMEAEGLEFEWLLPLLEETVQKLKTLSPEAAQTGPARRNDQQTMQKHLESLEDPFQKQLYLLLSQSIQQKFNTNTQTIGKEL